MNFTVRNEYIEDLLKNLGNDIKRLMPEGWGFSLQLFSFGEKGAMFYVSSAQRDDMIKTLEEMVIKLKEESNGKVEYDKH